MPIQLPRVSSCYFCRIVRGEVELWSILDDASLTLTLLNGRQFEGGQCLIVPKRHAPTLLDLSVEEAAATMAAARRIMQAMVEVFDPDGVLLYQNNGVGSGQEVPHFHLHVEPRRAQSDWGLGPPHIARLESSNRQAQWDHAAVTEEKSRTVEAMRGSLNRASCNCRP